MSATTSRQSAPAVSRRSYTSVGSFGLAFFKYSYAMNPQTLVEQGVLTVYGPNNDCPPGRILYENGKKIVPPQSSFPPIMIAGLGPEPYPLNSYMVGVFDPQSGLSGYIDPNSVNFAINSTDKPVFLNDNGGVGPATNIRNLGNPVLTHGPVLSLINEGNGAAPLPNYVGVAAPGVDFLNFGMIGGGNGQGIFDGPYALAISNGLGQESVGLATGQGGDPSTTNWAGMYASGDVYFTGSLYTKNTAGTATLNGATVSPSVTINNVLMGPVGSNPLVFVTRRTFSVDAGSAAPGALTYTLTRTGSTSYGTLVISSTTPEENSVVNWFVVIAGFDFE